MTTPTPPGADPTRVLPTSTLALLLSATHRPAELPAKGQTPTPALSGKDRTREHLAAVLNEQLPPVVATLILASLWAEVGPALARRDATIHRLLHRQRNATDAALGELSQRLEAANIHIRALTDEIAARKHTAGLYLNAAMGWAAKYGAAITALTKVERERDLARRELDQLPWTQPDLGTPTITTPEQP